MKVRKMTDSERAEKIEKVGHILNRTCVSMLMALNNYKNIGQPESEESKNKIRKFAFNEIEMSLNECRVFLTDEIYEEEE